MKVFGLRVFSASGAFKDVFGTSVAGVVAQDDRVYAAFDTEGHQIERKSADTDDYADLPGAPSPSADPQEWAEFIWTPGGVS